MPSQSWVWILGMCLYLQCNEEKSLQIWLECFFFRYGWSRIVRSFLDTANAQLACFFALFAYFRALRVLFCEKKILKFALMIETGTENLVNSAKLWLPNFVLNLSNVLNFYLPKSGFKVLFLCLELILIF